MQHARKIVLIPHDSITKLQQQQQQPLNDDMLLSKNEVVKVSHKDLKKNIKISNTPSVKIEEQEYGIDMAIIAMSVPVSYRHKAKSNNGNLLSKQTTLQKSPYTSTPIPNRKSANGSSSLNNSSYTDASTIINAAIDNVASDDDAVDSSYRVRSKRARRKIGKNSSGSNIIQAGGWLKFPM
ncbi:hypothetical protein TSAR_001072 [Trichomalopsis sarcophagae]|uniref:Uncharacterized protein n=1 Tax=Trichomalopsis sarcophagae TaxID=543379 RepID=A0A232ED66_9HYME|nr:hypothetical protein TSAR_001072 [Trichomalopsis sarcophagae]